MTLRIGIIGAGYLPQETLSKVYLSAGDIELVAALSGTRQSLDALAELCPVPVATTTPEEFWSAPLDAVHVCTPNHLHAQYACEALDRGLPTLVEKPVAASMAQGRAILAAARRSGAPALMGYMSKHNPANRRVIDLVNGGRIGRLLTMTASRHIRKDFCWRMLRSQGGLGSLGDLGIYPLVTALELFAREPVACQATGYPAGDSVLTDLHMQATVWFDDELTLVFESSFTYHEYGNVNYYTLFGERGLILVRESWNMYGPAYATVWDHNGEEQVDLPHVDVFAEQYRALAACAQGLPVPQELSIERGLRDLGILFAIDRSAAESGRRLELDPGFDPVLADAPIVVPVT